MTIRIMLADDHTLIRECLFALLAKVSGFELAGEAATGSDAVQLAQELRPDVVVMDLAMNDMGGIDATRLIAARLPQVKVLILSMHADRRFVAEAFNAGAVGFALKGSSSDELVAAIRAVAAGETYLSPGLQGTDGAAMHGVGACRAQHAVLTPREEEVLVLLAQGKSSRMIAEILRISSKTVETHRMHLMKKLKVTSIAALTKYAIRQGLLGLD